MGQLGELARSAAALSEQADVYIINPDNPENSKQVRRQTGVTLPILLDPRYSMARKLELAANGRPMGGLVGFLVIDGAGIIRVQRVDIDFGSHAGQILDIVRSLAKTGR
jgi:peroxiredoxin